MKAIKYAIEGLESYDNPEYTIFKEKSILSYSIDAHCDYSKCIEVRDRFENYMKGIDRDLQFDVDIIEIVFIENPAKSNQISIRNFEEDGTIHENLDVVRVGSRLEGYHFDIDIPDGGYIHGFVKLEIGKDYTLKEVEFRTFVFRGLTTISCYLDGADFNDYCDFVSEIMPECEVINLQQVK